MLCLTFHQGQEALGAGDGPAWPCPLQAAQAAPLMLTTGGLPKTPHLRGLFIFYISNRAGLCKVVQTCSGAGVDMSKQRLPWLGWCQAQAAR